MSTLTFASTVPWFSVADVSATMRWYEQQSGFHGDPFPQTEPYQFADLCRDGIEIMLQRHRWLRKAGPLRAAPRGRGDAYIRMTGVKELFESVHERVTVIGPLCKPPYGDWEFEVKDPNEYVLV